MSNMFHNATGVIGSAGKQLHSTTRTVSNTLQATTDRMLPPQQRKEIAQNLRIFAQDNPKLASFLAVQAVMAGLPLLLFLAFATTTLLVSLTTCLLLGLLAALAFTFFVVGFALIFVVPTIFIASCSATFVFIWGFLGYAILRRLNGGEAPDKRGTRIGDKLHGLKEGRIAGGPRGEHDDRKAAASVKTSSKKNGLTVNGTEVVQSTPHQENGKLTNGMNEANGDGNVIEWEQKWDSGVQLQPVVVAVDNPYDALKAETELS